MKTKLGVFSLAVLCAGCSFMPFYHRPQPPVPNAFPYQNELTRGNSAASIKWQEFFKDPRLQRLIQMALKNNRDLRATMFTVEANRAQYRILNNALLPSFEANADGFKQRKGAVTPHKSANYSVTLDASYELDFFGRIRSLKSQVLEQFLSSVEAQRSAQITLVSEVAIAYLNERALDEQLALVEQTYDSIKSYYDLIKKSYELGNTSEIDLRTTEAQMETARVNTVEIQRQLAQVKNAIELLIGQALPADLPKPQPLDHQELLADVPVGLPSDLLNRRPDILEAEHLLKAANANIGAVRAAFFPQVTLTGAAGTASIKLANLFAPGSDMWNFSPQITLPLFNRSNNINNLAAANAQQKAQLANYEHVIQSAFRDVADALAASDTLKKQIEFQNALVSAEVKRYDLAGARYRNGIDSYLTVLTAQRDLYNAQQGLIQAEYLELANSVTLYKALGGGF